MGLFLMDSLRITRLFPVIGALPDRIRVRMIWITFSILGRRLLQAIEFLNEKHPGRKTILIFSDLQEDLAKGYVRDVPLDLKGFEVVALNVTKLRSDNYDPRVSLPASMHGARKWNRTAGAGA